MPKLTPEQVAKLVASMEASPLTPEMEARSNAAAASSAAERRVDTSGEPAPSTSRGRSFLRGAVGGFAGTIDPVAQFIADRLAYTPTPMDVSTRGDVVSQTSIPASTDSTGKAFENFGEGVGSTVPFVPMAAAGAPAVGLSVPTAIGLELGAGGLGGLVQRDLEESGHPNLAAAGGLVLGSAANPIAATAGAAARKGGANLIDSIRLMTPEALSMARANEISRGAMVRGSSEIKRRVPDITATVDELRRRVTQSNQTGLPHAASSRQIVEGMQSGRGGRFFTDAERNLTTTDVDYARESALRFADNADALGRRWERMSNVDPDFGKFLNDYDEGASALKQTEREAWSSVREGDRPVFNTADLANQAEKIAGSAFFKSGDVPASIRQLADKRMTTMDLDRFQELRSVLLGVVRDAKRTGLSKDKHAAEMASQMLDSMQKKMDDFARSDATGKSAEWQRARQITLDNNEFYDLESPVIRSLDSGGQAKNLFSKMREARGRRGKRTDPVSEAQRLVRIAEQTPGGMENLRALAAEDLFQEGFTPTAIRQPDKILRLNEAMYRVVFGDNYDQMVELLDLTRLHTRGEAGTAAEAYRTGSGVSPASFLFGVAKSARNPVQAAVDGAMKLTGKQNARELEWQKIVRTAIEQPEFLRVLLEMPTARALPEWQVNWRRLLAASSAREASKAAARRAASEREMK